MFKNVFNDTRNDKSITKIKIKKVTKMIKINDNLRDRINKFLNILSSDFSSIDYVVKNKELYPTDELTSDHDFLSYMLKNYNNTSDLLLTTNDINEINVMYREMGSWHLTDIAIKKFDNYETARINKISFSTVFFKDHIQRLISKKIDDNNTSDIVYIPDFGLYVIISAMMESSTAFRIIKIPTTLPFYATNINWLNLDGNILYKIDLKIKDGFIIENSHFKLPKKIEDDIYFYIEETNKLHAHCEVTSYYMTNKLSIGLEYDKFGSITVNVYGNYEHYLKSEHGSRSILLAYLKENYKSFYKPIFKTLIETITEIKSDALLENFKDPECFKNYLTTLEMIKV
jgi:hypothetical protein